jgi:hypothetical protein
MKPEKRPAALHRCTLAGIAVQFAEGGRSFAIGDTVDLESQAIPGLTWRAALGEHADTFEPVAQDAPSKE